MDVSQLGAIEEIKRLKYRYMRCLDLKRWDEIGSCFTEDARCAYSGGRYRFDGREAIVGFLRESMGPEMITTHHVHHPEIALEASDRATGIWALEDTVIHLGHDFTLRGAAFYEDRYRRDDTGWRIQFTGYERIYEEVQPRKDVPGLRLTQNRWVAPDDGA